MNVRFVLGTLLGAVVLFAWGFVYHAALPFGQEVMGAVPDDVAAATAALGKSGIYYYPFMDQASTGDAAAEEAWAAQHRRGPLLFITYRAEGADPMAPRMFVQAFLHFWLSTVLAGLLLALAAPATYGGRALFLFLTGLFAAIAVGLSPAIWWYQPWSFTLYLAIFPASGWLLAAPAMAAVIRPLSVSARAA
jgi:hypothetical protein